MKLELKYCNWRYFTPITAIYVLQKIHSVAAFTERVNWLIKGTSLWTFGCFHFPVRMCALSSLPRSATTSNNFFYVHCSVHRVICVNNYPTRCNNIQFTYICKLLYMFRVVSPPISRSRQVTVTVSIMPDTVIWAADDGWRYHPKHVEQFADINKLYIVASCWTIIDTSV